MKYILLSFIKRFFVLGIIFFFTWTFWNWVFLPELGKEGSGDYVPWIIFTLGFNFFLDILSFNWPLLVRWKTILISGGVLILSLLLF